MRTLALWASWTAIAALAALSILAAFGGQERAKTLFNSWPMVVFWCLLIGVLAGGIASCPRQLLLRPASLAMHLGPILIIVGAMLGSDKAVHLAQRLLDRPAIPSGVVSIYRGEDTAGVYGRDGNLIGQLPFPLHLDDFRIVYYPWELWAATPTGPRPQDLKAEQIPWRVGHEFTVPFTQTRMTVLEYVESVRPVYAQGAAGQLEIRPPDAPAIVLPGKVGQETALAAPAIKVRITQVFSRLQVAGSGPQLHVFDADEGPENPAFAVEITDANGAASTRYVMSLAGMPPTVVSGAEFHYLPAAMTGVEPDPSTGSPAMRVRLRPADGNSVELWLVVPAGADKVALPLNALLGPAAQEPQEKATVWLARGNTPVRQYQSYVSVLLKGDNLAVDRQEIEVNHPLRYGGYSFTQDSWGQDGRTYTVLGVKYDAGLEVVCVGFALVFAGALWFCWGRPVLAFLRRRPHAHGD